jgi:hypothetical protein
MAITEQKNSEQKRRLVYDPEADRLFQEEWGPVSHRSQLDTPIRGHAEGQAQRSTQDGRRLRQP